MPNTNQDNFYLTKMQMTRRNFQLNDSKTEITIVKGIMRMVFSSLKFGGDQLHPLQSLNKSLEFTLTKLSFKQHIKSSSYPISKSFLLRGRFQIEKKTPDSCSRIGYTGTQSSTVVQSLKNAYTSSNCSCTKSKATSNDR